MFKFTNIEVTKNMLRLVLHKMDLSPPANAVRILGDILGLQFELKDIDILKLENRSSEYTKLNPLGTVPLLEDGDFVLSDSHAMMKYLLERYGGSQRETLYPSDVRTRALVDQSLFFDAGVYFIKLRTVTLLTIFQGLKGPTAKHVADIEAAYAVVEAYLGNKKYIATDHLTIADLSLGTTTGALQAIHKLDDKKFPRTVEWFARLHEKPFFKKYVGPASEMLENILVKYWEKNKKQ